MTKTIVPAIEVAKTYILTELSKIFSGGNSQKEIEEDISKLSEKEIWRLLEALSFTYRLNPVFWSISDGGLIWSKEEIDCNNLVLTGMNPLIDKVTHSETVQNNPIKFRDYLISYFKNHPKDDPEGLEHFRPKNIAIKFTTVLLIEKDDKLHLLDGSNRLVANLLKGNEIISAYVGRKVKIGRMRLGDSTFWLLRQVYEKGDESVKQAVLIIVKELINLSSDGKEAVETYWVSHVMDENLKKIGEQILSESSKENRFK